MRAFSSIALLLIFWSAFTQDNVKNIYDSAYSIGLSDKHLGITFLEGHKDELAQNGYEGQFYFYYAKLHYSLRYSMDTVAKYYELAHSILDESGIDSLSFEALYSLGKGYRTAGYYKASKKYFENAQAYALKHDLPILYGDALNSLGITYYRNFEHAEALTYYLKAKQVFLANGLPERLGRIYNNIGIIYKNFNDYEKAIEYYQKTIDIRVNNDIPARFSPYYNLNDIYHFQNNPAKAITYTKAAYVEALEQQNLYFQEDVLASLFEDYLALAYYDSAWNTLQMHLEISEHTVYDTAIYLEKLGSYYLATGNPDRAERALEKAIVIYKAEDDLYNEVESKVLLAQAKSDKKQYTHAINLLNETIRITKENELSYWHDESLARLQHIYSEAGMHELAYQKLMQLKNREDSIFNNSNASIVGGLEATYALLDEEKKNAVLVEETKNKALKIKNQQVTIVLIVITSLGVLIIGFLSYKQQKTKKELTESEKELIEKELIHKNQELVNFAVQITQKNEFIESLNEKVRQQKMDDLKGIIKANESITKDREEFESYVQNVCEGFFTKLNELYPEITSSEKRLAALLRLDLSSKEISTVLNISPKSVDQSRYRLRQKMKLSTEDSLNDSLKEI